MSDELHFPTLTSVYLKLHELRPRKHLRGQYAKGVEEGIREAVRVVDEMRMKKIKDNFMKEKP